MPVIKSKIIRVRNPVTGEWNDLPGVVSLESFRAAERADAAEAGAVAAQDAAERAQITAEAWATGGTGGTPGEENNALYWAGVAEEHAGDAAGSAETAEAWATGGSGGTPSAVNNAEYWSGVAGGQAEAAAGSAETAEAWATGGSGGTASATNNAEYWSGVAEDAAEAVSESLAQIAENAEDIAGLTEKTEAHVTRLPAGYTQVEYAESDSSNPTCSLGVKATKDTRLVCRFRIMEDFTALDIGSFVFGSRYDGSNEAFAFAASKGGKFWVNWNTGSYVLADADNAIHTVDINKNNFYLDGVLKNTASSADFESEWNIQLFGIRQGAGTVWRYGIVRIYSVQMYENDVLIRDCVPCIRESDGKVVMYDLVTQAAFGPYKPNEDVEFIGGEITSVVGGYKRIAALEENAEAANTDIETLQSGMETAQDDIDALEGDVETLQTASENASAAIDAHVTRLPAGYRQIEYAESDLTQMVTLGYHVPLNARMKIRFSLPLTVFDVNDTYYVFGARNTGSYNAYGLGYTNAGLFANYNTASYHLGSQDNYDNAVHTVEFLPDAGNSLMKFVLDGAVVKSVELTTTDGTKNMQLFGLMGNKNGSSHCYPGAVRIYDAQVYDSDGVLIHDCVPCVRESDGVVGIYDAAKNAFHPPYLVSDTSSTTTLAAGPDETLGKVYDRIGAIEDNTNVVPPYVTVEADRVAEKVRGVQTGHTVSFVAVSDLHYKIDGKQNGGDEDGAVIRRALDDMRDGVLAVANQVKIDFYTCFGDMIWRMTADGNFEKGKAEMIGVTKILNACFGNNLQIRLVGNHDPNGQGTTEYFTAYELFSFTGAYTNMYDGIREEEDSAHFAVDYLGNGWIDLERKKIRIVTLNTSEYWQSEEPAHSGTEYAFGKKQALWLCSALDLSGKPDAADWTTVVFAHVSGDVQDNGNTIGKRVTYVFDKYLSGGEWSEGTGASEVSYDFRGKNAARLALHICGHSHRYSFRNCRLVDASKTILGTMPLVNLYVPNALPAREEYPEFDSSMIYPKTAGTAESTAFQVITVDVERKTVYAHHYGAGIDIIMHYEPTETTTLTTALTSPVWKSVNEDVATVSNGVVTRVDQGAGYSVIYAKSTADNTIECWNFGNPTFNDLVGS